MTDDSPRTDAVQDEPTALRDYTYPLDTDDPAARRDDIDAFPGFGDASIVALGEATHGTREFFRLKHRFIRYLVGERDARTIAMEANLPEARAIDDYVTHGRGDPVDALASVYFWTWQTEEVVELLDWLREFNADRPLDDRVRFYGFDAQYTQGAVEFLRDFLDTVDSEFLDEVSAALEQMDDEGEPPAEDDSIDTILAAADRVLDRLAERFDAHRETYVAATSETGFAFARRCVRVCEQAVAYKRATLEWRESEDDAVMERVLSVRDEAMAENVRWIRECRDGPVVLWGHDAHVNHQRHALRAGRGNASAQSLGAHLDDEFGADYYALGFAFGSGSFQAMGERDGEFALREWTVDGPRPETFEGRLDPLGSDISVVDVRAASGDDRLANLLCAPTDHVSFGAIYHGDSLDDYVTEYTYGDAFDAVCYVAETTRARPV